MAKDRPPPLPYTKLYYADFFRDEAVECMTNDEIGAYLRLMHAAHDAHPPGQIPSDPTYLAAVSRMGTLWPAHSETIGRAFDTTSKPGFWVQKRIVREYSEARKQSVYGRIGAEVRWAAHREAIGEANATPMHSKRLEVENRENLESKPLSDPVGSDDLVLTPPSPKRDTSKTADTKDWLEGFDEFWKAYPHRANSSKKDALKVWGRIQPKDYRKIVEVEGGYTVADRLFQNILASLDESIHEWKRDRTEEKFIPHPSVWLNKELWRNDAEAEG